MKPPTGTGVVGVKDNVTDADGRLAMRSEANIRKFNVVTCVKIPPEGTFEEGITSEDVATCTAEPFVVEPMTRLSNTTFTGAEGMGAPIIDTTTDVEVVRPHTPERSLM